MKNEETTFGGRRESQWLNDIRATPIEEVAEKLGIKVVRHSALCPFHEDRHPSLRFKNNRFKCFACGASGDVIDLVMRYNNVGFKEAVGSPLLTSPGGNSPLLTSPGGNSPLLTSPRGGTKNALSAEGRVGGNLTLPPGGDGGGLRGACVGLELDLEYLSTLVAHPVINAEAAHFLYDERKIDPRVVRWCGLTSIDRPTPCWRWGKAFYDAPSLLIPYRDVNGKLLTVQGRRLSPLLTSPRGGTKNALSAEGRVGGNLTLPPGGDGGGLPRFRFPRGSHVGMYNKPVIRRLKADDELWITEGPSDCWAILSAGKKAVAIPSATSLTMADIGLLRDGLPDGVSLHMYPDNDEPGMLLFEGLKRWFPQLKGHVLPQGFKDFGQWYAEVGLPPSSGGLN